MTYLISDEPVAVRLLLLATEERSRVWLALTDEIEGYLQGIPARPVTRSFTGHEIGRLL
jgi:hypothetical protein